MRPFYRVWQFWQAVTARPLDERSKAEISMVLSSGQVKLFSRLPVSDQQHSYRVFSTLRQSGIKDKDLLAAALLHDIGKTVASRYWWDKVIVVLGNAFWPGKAAEWASGKPSGIRRPFVIKAFHAEWGASAAETAKSSPLTVSLIRHHHSESEFDGELKEYLPLLRWADDNS